MAEEEHPSRSSSPEPNSNKLSVYVFREQLMERAQSLLLKYIQVPGDLAVSIDHLSLKDGATPNCRLSENLLPLLQKQLKKLMLSLDPGNLHENTRYTLDATLDDFQKFEHTLDLISLAVPLCWAEGGAEVSESDDLEFRRLRLRREHLQLTVHLSSFFCAYNQFWQSAKFSENFTPKAEAAKIKTIEASDTSSQQIDVLIRFLKNPLFNVINQDLQSFVKSINYALINRINQWASDSQHQYEDFENPMIPVIKLTRVFMNKFSKLTNNAIILFRRMCSKELVPLQRAAVRIPYWVDRLGNQVHYNPHQLDDVVDGLARVIGSLDKCFEHLKPVLKSPPPEVDPCLVQAVSQWFTIWRDQLFIALHNLSYFIGCDFPTDEHCASISTDPFEH